ncbi:MAG TPA: hypothetical protein DCS39_05410 [Rhodobiaceae bacterium]|nr:hypothetical protein [Rhodobiaceae bacterium]
MRSLKTHVRAHLNRARLADQRLEKTTIVLGALILEWLGPLLQDWRDRNLPQLVERLTGE